MGAILGQTMAYDRTVEDTALAASIKEVLSSSNVGATVWYDTKHDSECGHWRMKCTGLSWFDEGETSNYRSARKEAPSRMLIVANNLTTVRKLNIYDADDPSLPLWMAFDNENTSDALDGNDISGVYAINGRICVAHAAGVTVIDFVNDEIAEYSTSGKALYKSHIADRNDASGYHTASGTGIVNNAVNAVAAFPYPGSDIDRLGLLVPTVAVATDGGVSVIHPSGDVYDSSSTTAKKTINFNNVGQILAAFYNATESAIQIYDYVDTFADGFGQQSLAEKVHASASVFKCNFLGSNPLISILSGRIAVGTDEGVTLYNYNRGDIEESAVAYITSKYNTGFMHGDIRGAWGLDKDHAATIVGSELVTNGDFATDTDWTKGTGWTIASGVATCDGLNSLDVIYQSVVATSGVYYLIEFEITAYTSGALKARVGNTRSSTTAAATGKYQFTILGDGQSFMGVEAASTFNGSIDNISVRVAIPDRSVKDNGLGVYGTLNVGAVSTGADLRALSGFSASNYASQPNNSDLDFGTGDFHITTWLNTSDVGAQDVISRNDSSSEAGDWTFHISAGEVLQFYRYQASWVKILEYTTAIATNVWHKVDIIKFNGNIYLYLNGELVDSAADALSYTPAGGSTLNIGRRLDASYPATGCSLALPRISATAPTPEQIKDIYEMERPLFFDNALCTLQADQVNDVSYDPVTRILEVAEEATTGSSRISGLEVIEVVTSDDDYGLAASKQLDLIDSMGGYRVAVTDGGAGANLPSEEIRDSLNEPGHKGYDSHVVHFNGVTTDGSATVIGRIYVEEGESVAITAHFQGKDYTDPTSKYAHYTVAAHIARPIGGDVTLNGSVQSVHTAIESSAGYDATMIVTTASQTIGFEVTGADRMVWTAHVECEWELKKI